MPDIQLECKLAREYTMDNFPGAIAYLLIKAIPDPSISTITMPLNLGLLIDVSRSMAGKKIKCAKEAAKLIVHALRPDDFISITVFSDKARTIIPRQQLNNVDFVLSQIDKIDVVAGTRMYLGMETAISDICKDSIENLVNRMILLTDGETEREEDCLFVAGQRAGSRLPISSYGIGDRYNEDLLLRISDLTLGSFYHLRLPEEIAEHFNKDVESALNAVIANSTLDLDLLESVQVESAYRIFPNTVKLQPERANDGNTYHFNLGNLSRAEITCFGIQLKLPARQAGRVCVADMTFSYFSPLVSRKNQLANKIFVEYTADRNLCSHVDREVLGYFNQVNAQTLVSQATDLIKKGKIQDATNILAQVRYLTQRIGNANLTKVIDNAVEEVKKTGAINSDILKTMLAEGRQTIRIEHLDRDG
jgi:Ca-activated chloride channel family protein